MAIPTISSTPYPSAFVDAKADTVSPVVDYETGGIGLQDPSAGLQYQTWTCQTDGSDITIEADNSPAQVIYSGANITEISLAFDSNMNYFVAFVEDGQAKFKWFDSTISAFTVNNLDALDENPRCTLDDKRSFNNSGRSVVLLYLRNDNLYGRYQNDRYATEYNLGAITAGKKLAKIGMMDNLRIGYVLSDALTIETPSGAFIPPWNKLAISFFVRPSLSSGDANAIAIGQSKIAVINYNKDSGLYLKLPNNQELRLYEEGFPEDYTYMVAVNLSKVLNKTKVELLAKRLDDCLDTEKITGEYTSTELGGSHVITQIKDDSKIYIGDPRASTPDVSLIFDRLQIREKWYTTTEIDELANTGGYCDNLDPSGDLQASFWVTPSQDFPENGFTELLWTSAPGGHEVAVMEKDISIIISNIKGGDGGPYTVDFSGLVWTNNSSQSCPDYANVSNGFIYTYTGATGSSSTDVRTDAAADLEKEDVDCPTVTAKLQYSGADPINGSGIANIQVKGQIIVTDGSANTITINVPKGLDGEITGDTETEGDTYADNFQWGNSHCIPL